MSHDMTDTSVHPGKQFYKVHKMEPSLMEAGQVLANTDWECSVMVSQTNQLSQLDQVVNHSSLFYS